MNLDPESKFHVPLFTISRKFSPRPGLSKLSGLSSSSGILFLNYLKKFAEYQKKKPEITTREYQKYAID